MSSASSVTGRILSIVLPVALVMFAAVLHEVAHGWVAYKCGDNTAKNAGRLTLNPAKAPRPLWLGHPARHHGHRGRPRLRVREARAL
jgi:hypothetical protein